MIHPHYSLPIVIAFCVLLYTYDVRDYVDIGAIRMAVIIAATAHRSALAGATHVATLYHVIQALEGAVVLGPSVLDQRVAEAHVVVELLLHPEGGLCTKYMILRALATLSNHMLSPWPTVRNMCT